LHMPIGELINVMETVELIPTTGFVQKRVRGDVVLNSTQEAILRAAKPGEVLLVYRTKAEYGRGCSHLAAFLGQRCGWERGTEIFGPKHVELTLAQGRDVVFDCTCAFQAMTAKKNNFFRALHTTDKRVIVMCHGVPPPVGTLMDVTHMPKADY